LQYEHRAWLVEDRNVVEHGLRAEYPDAIERGGIVSVTRGEDVGELDQLTST
jgi:hypothetical protein